eukprot:TRINITY_DN8252_c0_g1_i1.p1 TRINITY_DN8252_c0_g1~~TRINITY_DN8252_c0_g1_i1.p1  ORF type:complete len:142 (-),score=16.32 TRINITY_DN8252_c0_g1_i1:37-462(-)
MLSDVLKSKQGIPVALSVIYAAVARRVGLLVHGTRMPGHFVLKYTFPDGSSLFIDSFQRGRLLTGQDLMEMGLSVTAATVRSTDHHSEIWLRMLRNIMFDHDPYTRYLMGSQAYTLTKLPEFKVGYRFHDKSWGPDMVQLL